MDNSEKSTLYQRILDARAAIHQLGGFVPFGIWCKKKKYRGFSNPSITNMLAEAKAGENNALLVKVARLTMVVEEYLTENPPNLIQSTNTENHDSIEQKMWNTQWYIYFYYPIPKHESDVEFARAVLKIDAQGAVEIRNIEDGVSPNYMGSFRIIKNETLVMDVENTTRGKHLHIKTYLNPEIVPSEILLGGFLSNGRDYISAGTVLLEKQAANADLSPAHFSYHHHTEVFNDTNQHIRALLKVRSLNYLRIPPAVFLKSNLKDARKGESPHPNTRFIEPDKPVIFISAPTYSVQDETYRMINLRLEEIIREFEFNYQDKVEFRFFAFRDIQRQTRLEYLKVLNDIRGASAFLLLFLEKASSNALIELGMAYAYSKNVKILAKRDALPNNGFLKNGSQHITLKEYGKESLDEIFRDFTAEIIHTLQVLHVYAPSKLAPNAKRTK